MYHALIRALDAGGVHGFNLAYLERCHGTQPPPEATAHPLSLLTWLREPHVNNTITWPQDVITARGRPEPHDGLDWIAHENQFLWAVALRSGDESSDPIVELFEPRDGTAPQRLLGRMLLSELTTRILYQAHSWVGELRDPTSHGLYRLVLDRRVLEPATFGHQTVAGWGGIGLARHWYCTFNMNTIRIHTHDPERMDREFRDNPHLTWVPRDGR